MPPILPAPGPGKKPGAATRAFQAHLRTGRPGRCGCITGPVGGVKIRSDQGRRVPVSSPENMASKSKEKDDAERLSRERIRRQRREFESSYRARALRLFPWICARCGREFGGRKLQELTVHHKDHNHDNNPPDGSNWELLCIYCHENEHSRFSVADASEASLPGDDTGVESSYRPFEGLADLLKRRD